MTKRMLIDATHHEETRVAVIDGKRLEEFDYESAFRKPIKGNIFLAKVTRVEPSLQAAFVNFGGNRHGFLPFSEIHPDYFRIPIADREALIAEQEALAEEAEAKEEELDQLDQEEAKAASKKTSKKKSSNKTKSDDTADEPEDDAADETALDPQDIEEIEDDLDDNENVGNRKSAEELELEKQDLLEESDDLAGDTEQGDAEDDDGEEVNGNTASENGEEKSGDNKSGRDRGGRGRGRGGRGGRGGNSRGRRYGQHRGKSTQKYELSPEQRFRQNLRRKYKIQEVIKRGQIMLVQASKEERGNKGAAVGSYLSLPGRYCVLMPNSPRAGGVSRKIANYKDRARMREIMKELEVPKGMSVILRTAGVQRTKAEIKRDLDYLMRLWDNIRGLTLESSAPALVYEEADLIKRSVRDLYTRDIDEIVVAGEAGYKNARNFMKMIIPSHVKKVKEYKENNLPLFNRFQIEKQITEIGETQVTLPAGGYLVINPTEALVSVDVNSGKATKERHIEETALRTNLEAAEEVARQLRLRDLGGLVVVDFIDMEDRRNNGKVERKMRDALSGDRARTQMGRISSFGLMELSRQRLSPSLTESQFDVCKHCDGSGRIRTADAASIMVIRALEEEGMRGRAAQLIAHVPNEVAQYILNNKRTLLNEIEGRYSLTVLIRVDDDLNGGHFRVEVSKPADKGEDADENAGEDNNANSSNARSNNNNNNSSGEQGERTKRRRGRRGGRRRGRRNEQENDNNNENKNHAGDESKDADKKADKQGETSAQADDSNKESGRARKNSPKDEKDDKPSSKDSSKDSDKTAKEQSEEKAKPKKRASKKKDEPKTAKKNEDADKKTAKDVSDKPKRKAATKKDTKKVSNDDKQEAPKDYETVNEAPKKKKKGWWSRATGE